MSLRQTLISRWPDPQLPFLLSEQDSLSLEDVLSRDLSHLEAIEAGQVVALVGDFTAQSIAEILALIERRAIVVPLTVDTRSDHEYFFSSALVDWVIEGGRATRRPHTEYSPHIDNLRHQNNPGLVLFSTGTTGRPKAILHDMSAFLKRFETPRPTLRTMAFLLFDHIGGINTLFHTMFNGGIVVSPGNRSIATVLAACHEHDVELLPTTPTFLRMMLMSGIVPDAVPETLKIVTYGTERMDQTTLEILCEELPWVDFRQTYGMSELGILRVKSKAKNSLFMRIGGEGVKTRISSGVLEIWSPSRMLGYLNADSPFDDEGWYRTGDLVDVDGDFIRVVGRESEVINVGGLKFMASEIERVVLEYPGISLVSVTARPNPVTGEHVELTVQPVDSGVIDEQRLREFLESNLPAHMRPLRITVGSVHVSHRFKR
jgi:acyl-CoA synthetase (AMP-forming)/AMP-acid ligase II